MSSLDPFRRLLYQHEVLRARHEIREYYLKRVTREVYENIGQVLSLVGLELGMVEPGGDMIVKEKVERMEELVRQTIRDLRQMSRSFYKDLNGFAGDDLVDALRQELNLARIGSHPINIRIVGDPIPITDGPGVILFRVLQEILTEVSTKAKLISVSAIYKEDTVSFIIHYQGDPVKWENVSTNTEYIDDFNLNILKKIELIDGTFETKTMEPDQQYIELVIHIKTSVNEQSH